MSLLQVTNLTTSFHTRKGIVRAVRGISYSLEKGQTLGIVGESGSGKSVSCYSLLRLLPTPPARIEGGTALFHGEDLLSISDQRMRSIRGSKISMIFQDPMTSLNPFLKVGYQLTEPLIIHQKMSKTEARKHAIKALEDVLIQDAEKRLNAYPHEFSGGMRQRVMIAMALITKPQILIADEPSTALDVTVQAQILELIKKLQKEHNTSVIFITHDLGVIANIADNIAVMYGGEIVEYASADQLFSKPLHPYTEALLHSIPSTQKRGTRLQPIPGNPPDMSKPIEGCTFAPRCSLKKPECLTANLKLLDLQKNHLSMCLRRQQEAGLGA